MWLRLHPPEALLAWGDLSATQQANFSAITYALEGTTLKNEGTFCSVTALTSLRRSRLRPRQRGVGTWTQSRHI